MTDGADRVAAWEPEGRWAELFCRDCGSRLFSRAPVDPDVMAVSIGAVDGDPGIRPEGRPD